jgi:hypothetical protein
MQLGHDQLFVEARRAHPGLDLGAALEVMPNQKSLLFDNSFELALLFSKRGQLAKIFLGDYAGTRGIQVFDLQLNCILANDFKFLFSASHVRDPPLTRLTLLFGPLGFPSFFEIQFLLHGALECDLAFCFRGDIDAQAHGVERSRRLIFFEPVAENLPHKIGSAKIFDLGVVVNSEYSFYLLSK